MGTLTYRALVFEFDDRLLAHLQIVIIAKLRRRESFAMSWRDPAESGGGRSAIWLDPSIPLYFQYDGSPLPEIDREWIERLAMSAESSHGLVVSDKGGDPVVAPERAFRHSAPTRV